MWLKYDASMSEVKAGFLFPVRLFFGLPGGTHQQLWVYTNHSKGYYIYVLFIVLLIRFIFKFFLLLHYSRRIKKKTFFFFKLRGKKRSTLLWKGKKMAEECRRESSTPSCSVVYFTHVFFCVLWPKCDSQVVTGHVGGRWELTERLEIYSGPNIFKSVCCKALAHRIGCWIISSEFVLVKQVFVRLVRV